MDLSDPMRAVLPTLDGPVLRVLAGTTRPLTGREVHRLAGVGSEAGVRRVLHRLVDQGLVTVSVAGPSRLYVGNRHHLAWSSVETLVRLRERFWDRLASLFARWDPQPVLAGVFGSAARETGTVDSDIDLLLVRPDSLPPEPLADSDNERVTAWIAQVNDVRDAVRSMTGNPVQIFEVSDREFRDLVQSDDPLADSWRRELRILAGESPWQRIRSGRVGSSASEAGQ